MTHLLVHFLTLKPPRTLFLFLLSLTFSSAIIVPAVFIVQNEKINEMQSRITCTVICFNINLKFLLLSIVKNQELLLLHRWQQGTRKLDICQLWSVVIELHYYSVAAKWPQDEITFFSRC